MCHVEKFFSDYPNELIIWRKLIKDEQHAFCSSLIELKTVSLKLMFTLFKNLTESH